MTFEDYAMEMFPEKEVDIDELMGAVTNGEMRSMAAVRELDKLGFHFFAKRRTEKINRIMCRSDGSPIPLEYTKPESGEESQLAWSALGNVRRQRIRSDDFDKQQQRRNDEQGKSSR